MEVHHISPYNNTNYQFITENSKDIKDSWIKYAEEYIDRSKNQIEISDFPIGYTKLIDILNIAFLKFIHYFKKMAPLLHFCSGPCNLHW